MSKQLINESTLTDIADAIRSAEGSVAPMYPSEMAPKIRNLTGQYVYIIPEGRPHLADFVPHKTDQYVLLLYQYGEDIKPFYSLITYMNKSSYHAAWYIYGYSSANEAFTLLSSFTTASASSTAYTDSFPVGLSYDYMMIEIVPQENDARINYVRISDVDQCIVARYMKLPYLNSASNLSIRGVEHDMWDSVTYRGTLANMWSRSRRVEQIEFINCHLTPTSMTNTFQQCYRLRAIKGLEDFDLSACNDLKGTFTDCFLLTDFDAVEHWDVSHVTVFESCFSGASAYLHPDLHLWDVSAATSFYKMFSSAGLWDLDISMWTPTSVTTMASMFYGSARLMNLKMPQCQCTALTTMDSICYNCTGLEWIDLTDFDTPALTTIHYAWYGCFRLHRLDMSDMNLSNVTSLTTSDFGYQLSICCKVVFPDDMVMIGNSAMEQAKAITSIVIPASVTSIGSKAFSECGLLSSVTLLSNSVVTLTNSNALASTSANLVIYVPADLVSSYQGAANWSTYASQIVAIGS